MVDLDSSPTKLIEIVEIGKQLLMTRGSLTTFSIANDVAKYFAIIPALFVDHLSGAGGAQHHGAGLAAIGDPVGGHLQRADHRRADPAGAEGRRLSSVGAAALLRRNLLVYGLGGLLAALRRHQADRPRRLRSPSGVIMLTHLRPAIVLTSSSSCSPALAYPLAITGIGQLAFPAQANGSLIRNGDRSSARADRPDFAVRPLFLAAPLGRPADGPTMPALRPAPTSARPRPNLTERVEGRRRAAAGQRHRRRRSRPTRATASGSGLDPAHLAGICQGADRACRHGARHAGRGSRGAGRSLHRRPLARYRRRAARQRAAAQSGAGCA